MRAGVLLLSMTLGVGGCGYAQQMEIQESRMAAQSRMQDQIAECKKRYPDLTRGNAETAIRCTNVAYVRSGMANGAIDSDLVNLAGLKAEQAAAKFDAGKITKSEFDLELAQINTEYQTAAQARVSQANASVAAMQQADAIRRQAAMQQMATGLAIMSATPPPPPPMQMPKQTNCQTYGNRTNCTTY